MRKKTMRLVWIIGVLALGGWLGLHRAGAEPDQPVKDRKEVKNLLPNGDFEEGDATPRHWQTIDGLTTFWVKDADPKRGKAIKFDTDVLQSQGYEWWGKIARAKGTAKDAPAKLPTTPPKYDTLAGLDGVWLWSDPIPAEKGKAYWLTIDVKGPGLLVWLVGYPDKPDTAFGADAKAFQEYLRDNVLGKPRENKRGFDSIIAKYVWRGQLAAGGTNEWKTYSRREKPFRPTRMTPNVKWLRVLVLPTWPPGEYWIDNVRLTEIEDKEE